MWLTITERCSSVFSSDSRHSQQTCTWRPQRSGRFRTWQQIRNVFWPWNHSVLYNPTAGFRNLFFERQEASWKVWEVEWCDLPSWFSVGLQQQRSLSEKKLFLCAKSVNGPFELCSCLALMLLCWFQKLSFDWIIFSDNEISLLRFNLGYI